MRTGEISTTSPTAILNLPWFPYISERREFRPLHLEAGDLMKTVPTKYEKYVQEIEGSNLIFDRGATSNRQSDRRTVWPNRSTGSASHSGSDYLCRRT